MCKVVPPLGYLVLDKQTGDSIVSIGLLMKLREAVPSCLPFITTPSLTLMSSIVVLQTPYLTSLDYSD